jgi:hypothetical protein
MARGEHRRSQPHFWYINRSRSRSSSIPSFLPSHYIYTTILAASWTTHIKNILTIMTAIRVSPLVFALLLSCSFAQAFPSRPFSPMAESVQKVSYQALFNPTPSTHDSRTGSPELTRRPRARSGSQLAQAFDRGQPANALTCGQERRRATHSRCIRYGT